MKLLLMKEFRLAAHPLSFIFIAFSAMTFIPGYPILFGAFFVCLGIFYSYQQLRESDDITYSVLLPVRKRDVVRAKYMFALIIQMISFLLCVIFTVIRQLLMADAAVYLSNKMMNANALYLGFLLIIFALFNLIFIGGFFRTAYKIGIPFLAFTIISVLAIAVGETLHHLPSLAYLNDAAGVYPAQLGILAGGIVFYIITFILSCVISEKNFERIDL